MTWHKQNINLDLQFHPRKEIVAEPEEESERKSCQGKYEWKLEIRHATEFSGDHKKEDPNNEECEIKIDGMEEPAEENVIKTSENLEMDELTRDPVADTDQDEEDINFDGEKWIHWYTILFTI